MPYRPKMFTKWVVGSRKWKDRHYNRSKEQRNNTNNSTQTIHRKL